MAPAPHERRSNNSGVRATSSSTRTGPGKGPKSVKIPYDDDYIIITWNDDLATIDIPRETWITQFPEAPSDVIVMQVGPYDSWFVPNSPLAAEMSNATPQSGGLTVRIFIKDRWSPFNLRDRGIFREFEITQVVCVGERSDQGLYIWIDSDSPQTWDSYGTIFFRRHATAANL